ARPSSTWGGRQGLRDGGSSGVGPANETSLLGSVRYAGGLGNLAYTRLVGRQPPVRGREPPPSGRSAHPTPPRPSPRPTQRHLDGISVSPAGNAVRVS
ncbi:Mitochondrial carrier-like protein 1, partial [Frankliniella fusca]